MRTPKNLVVKSVAEGVNEAEAMNDIASGPQSLYSELLYQYRLRLQLHHAPGDA